MAKSASLMRIAAIAAILAQGVAVLSSTIIEGKISGIAGVIIPVALAGALLNAASGQKEYANGGTENKLLDGLKKEIVYWRIAAISTLIGIIFIGLPILSILIGGEPILKGYIHHLPRILAE